MVLSFIEAPFAVKALAPPLMQLLVTMFLPVRWTKHDAEIAPDGRKLCAVLETEFNCMSTSTVRPLSRLLKNHAKSIELDLALAINKPVDQEEEELQACIGMWRFDHVDIPSCPQLPDRYTEEAEATGQSRDSIRLSKKLMPENDIEFASLWNKKLQSIKL